MKKTLTFSLLVIAFAAASCSNTKKSNEEIDSLNKAGADSLLNAALADTATLDEIDTLKVDTIKMK